MKSILQLNKPIIIFLLFIFIYAISCSESKHGHTGGIQVIQITDGVITNNSLTMRTLGGANANNFSVKHGDKIQWLLISNNTVKQVTRIYKKPNVNSDDVFSSGPDSVGGSPNWRATVKIDAGGKTEDYNIDWIDITGTSHTYDPKIQVY
jgi:hypothetical protein